eukprot:scaffold85794_cov48-Phaeocystis_antarctica.AAC.2
MSDEKKSGPLMGPDQSMGPEDKRAGACGRPPNKPTAASVPGGRWGSVAGAPAGLLRHSAASVRHGHTETRGHKAKSRDGCKAAASFPNRGVCEVCANLKTDETGRSTGF